MGAASCAVGASFSYPHVLTGHPVTADHFQGWETLAPSRDHSTGGLCLWLEGFSRAMTATDPCLPLGYSSAVTFPMTPISLGGKAGVLRQHLPLSPYVFSPALCPRLFISMVFLLVPEPPQEQLHLQAL